MEVGRCDSPPKTGMFALVENVGSPAGPGVPKEKNHFFAWSKIENAEPTVLRERGFPSHGPQAKM